MRLIRQMLAVARDDGVRHLLAKGRTRGPAMVGAELSNGVQRLNRIRYGIGEGETRITDADWDHLLLLDACRYDQFRRLHAFPGEVEPRISVGSATPEFLERTFGGESCFDTVYVTANPMYRHVGLDQVFHAVVDVWQTHWDEDRRTVWPEAVFEATQEARERYPNKRILSHFMQPHYPFLGETGRKISHAGFEWTKRIVEEGESSRDDPTVWALAAAGEISDESVRAAYDENLEMVLPYVEGLVDTADGRTVVTSDHGNLLGERIAPFDGKRYGHPPGTDVDALRKVPWLVIETGDRRRIEPEPPEGRGAVDQTTVRDRLAHLGYTDPPEGL